MEGVYPFHDHELTFLAETDFRGTRRRFGIKRRDRRHHLYVLGKTGMGKSTLLRTLVASDLRGGNGLALIDPHGDLAQDVLPLVPEGRAEDLIAFDPSTARGVVAFNPLDVPDPSRRHLAASGLVAAFKKIWADSWGPRMEYILYNTLRALLDFPGASLLDVPRLLTDADYRKIVLRYGTDPRVAEFWFEEFDGYPKTLRAEALAPIQNKVGQYLASPLIRRVLGRQDKNLDLRRVMDEGKVLIANLSKGKLGEAASALLGALLISGCETAALGRADIPESHRRDFYLYIDEWRLRRFAARASIRARSSDTVHGLRDRALVEVLCSTGMRISEALSLDRDAIDWDASEARIVGKGNRERSVYFSDAALQWLGEYLRYRHDAERALFATHGYEPRRLSAKAVWKACQRYSKAAGLSKRVHPHMLRHTMATTLLANGCPIGHIRVLLGHAHLATTCRYYLGKMSDAEAKAAHATYLRYDERSKADEESTGRENTEGEGLTSEASGVRLQ